MKLLFFSNTLKGGGAERVLVNLANELVCRGYDVTIALNENESHYDVDSRIRIYAAGDMNWYKGRNIILRFQRNILMRRFYMIHTKNAIIDIKPDIIIVFHHCNMEGVIKYHGKIPIIHSEHNAYDRDLGCRGYYQRFHLNRFFNTVCVLTPFDQGYAKAKGLKNTIVMPNPNSFESITTDEYEIGFSSRKNILVCGRTELWRVKGLDIAIMAFSRVAHSFPGVDLDIVGGFEIDSLGYLQHLSEEYGVDSRVHFLGHRADIMELMRQHKLFLLSSRTEGFPMVVTEAMSQGLPCLSFERLSSSIIIDGEDGVLSQDQDIDLLSCKLSQLLEKNNLLYRMGLQASENVKRFSPEKIVERWERLFGAY